MNESTDCVGGILTPQRDCFGVGRILTIHQLRWWNSRTEPVPLTIPILLDLKMSRRYVLIQSGPDSEGIYVEAFCQVFVASLRFSLRLKQNPIPLKTDSRRKTESY